MVTSPSRIRKSCSVILYGVKTNFAHELEGERSEGMHRHEALYVKDGFVVRHTPLGCTTFGFFEIFYVLVCVSISMLSKYVAPS